MNEIIIIIILKPCGGEDCVQHVWNGMISYSKYLDEDGGGAREIKKKTRNNRNNGNAYGKIYNTLTTNVFYNGRAPKTI